MPPGDPPDTVKSLTGIHDDKNEMKTASIGTSGLINLSLKSLQRKDGTLKRCGKCASCRHRCGECKPCCSDKKAQLGCKKRYVCLRNSHLIDDPALLGSCLKRTREEELDIDFSKAKDMKLSKSPTSTNVKSVVERLEQGLISV